MKKYVFLILIHIIAAQAQNNLKRDAVVDSGNVVLPATALTHSLILPGWGQLNQEKLWNATFFFGLDATFYYNAAYQFYRAKYNDEAFRLDKGRALLSVAVFVHVLNILDAWDRSVKQKPRYWHSTLFNNKPLKSPWGATVRSLMIPGWGQVYNDQYLKAGLFSGLIGYVGYTIYDNDRLYKRTHEGRYLDQRTRFYWYLGLTYLLMLGDAQVDAYLYKFDKTTKLLFNPTLTPKSATLNFRLEF